MSQFTKSLEKRIQELTASIDAQKVELAAYERVLHMELSKGTASAESATLPEKLDGKVPAESTRLEEPEGSKPAASVATPDVPVKTNKTTMVAEVVKSYGSQGATPKDVDAFFTARNIQRSKNLVYNTLSYLVAQRKLTRSDGRYFALTGNAAATKKKRGPAPKAAKEAESAKRRLSPEGLQKIKEALRKRWAAKRAADASSKPATHRAPGKK